MEQYFGDNLFNAMERNPVEIGSIVVQQPDSDKGAYKRDALLVIDHSPRHTMALSLTRPSEAAVANVLPEWAPLLSSPGVFYAGGITSPEGVLGLGVLRNGLETENPNLYEQVCNRIVLLNMQEPAEVFEPYLEVVRLFAGHTTWQPGELHAEIEMGHWFVAPALPSDVIAGRMADVWGDVLKRQNFPLSVLSTFTEDHEEN
ncbi:hypothetical protein CCICO_11445 [Corynebacterium ciconiae DSM 44920]|uniref:YqgE/AlgH family protein n=1 Tax=Corynebacterium ciconiae TaxID=227319 RepID=UPI000366976B|nr:YqgE/AlgH family protein [Corynebacterium ciconiae]WKD62280.1 hypothetical protein CCICO_11445 [Corynebacterium ciconiae DSM 44920]